MLITTTQVLVASPTGSHASRKFIALSFAAAFVLMMTLASHISGAVLLLREDALRQQ